MGRLGPMCCPASLPSAVCEVVQVSSRFLLRSSALGKFALAQHPPSSSSSCFEPNCCEEQDKNRPAAAMGKCMELL